jgi:hypothetical protein
VGVLPNRAAVEIHRKDCKDPKFARVVVAAAVRTRIVAVEEVAAVVSVSLEIHHDHLLLLLLCHQFPPIRLPLVDFHVVHGQFSAVRCEAVAEVVAWGFPADPVQDELAEEGRPLSHQSQRFFQSQAGLRLSVRGGLDMCSSTPKTEATVDGWLVVDSFFLRMDAPSPDLARKAKQRHQTSPRLLRIYKTKPRHTRNAHHTTLQPFLDDGGDTTRDEDLM